LAEDVQTDLDQNAWPAAEAKLRELRGVGQQLAAADVARALDSLSVAITRRSRTDALVAANRVSRAVTDIMAGYSIGVPVDVTYMDVAGRDLLYAAREGRWSTATESMAEMGRRYATVQNDVRARNPALDRRVTSEMASLRRAVTRHERARTTSLAQALLEEVDRIEQAL
jgi:spore germination protein YaaH